MGVIKENAGLHRRAWGHPGQRLDCRDRHWLGVVHEDPGNAPHEPYRQAGGEAGRATREDRTTVLGRTVIGLSHFFGVHLCMRLKRLDWGAHEAERLLAKIMERRK